MNILYGAVLGLGMVLTALPAQAQSVGKLQREINELREDIVVLQRKAYRTQNDSQMAPQTAADMSLRMGQFDELLRDVIGKTDELEFKIKKLNERIDLLNKDMDIRIKMLEGKPLGAAGGGAAAGASGGKFAAPVAKSAPKSVTGDSIEGSELKPLKSQDVNAIYQEGLEALKADKPEAAAKNFEMILSKFPNDKLAGNAQYWLGEVYYGKKDYQRAAVAFGKGYQNYKSSAKGPDNLLKLGMSMRELGKKEEACAAFQNLPSEFPQAEESVKTKAAAQAKAAGCK